MLYCIKTTLQCSRIPKLHTLKGHLTPLIRQVNATSFSPLQQKTPSNCQASVAYRMIVRYFIRQLRFLLESGEVEVYFWPNPAEDKDRRRLIEKEKKGSNPPFMFSSGAGGRTRTGTSASPLDFESSASANSATPAQYVF